MKKGLISIALVAFTAMTLSAQPKVVHFKKLQELLPTKDFPGVNKRNKPTGNTQTSMGMSTSEASVRYTTEYKEGAPATTEQQKSIEVKISDMVMVPYALMAFNWQQEVENESEEGYEKSVTVKNKYKGKEEGRTGESKSCKVQFGVAGRFLVEINADGYPDSKILYTVVDAMDLAKLEKQN